MFRVLILGEAAIVLSMAALAFLSMQHSDVLKKKPVVKWIIAGMVVLALILFALSFDSVRGLLTGVFL